MARLKARESVSLLLVITIILSLFIIAVPMAGMVEAQAGDAYYVNADYGNDNLTADQAKNRNTPWITIQHAVDTVPAESTINVAAGTYDEQVVISKSLTLQGEGDATTTIQAPSTMTQTTWKYDGKKFQAVIEVNGESDHSITVNINGFTIDGLNKASDKPRFTGIVYHDADGTVSGNTITKFGHDPVNGEDGWGIWVVGGSTVTIEKNTVNHYAKGGIVVEGSKISATVTGNTVTGSGTIDTSVQNGIQISQGATGTVSNNIASDHSYTGGKNGWASGITIFGSDNVTINGNTASSNDAGIIIQDGGNNTVQNNTINNNYIGIWTLWSDDNTYTGNTVNGASCKGIYFWESKGNALTSNTVQNVHCAGLDAWGIAFDGDADGSDSNTVENNIVRNSHVGIWVGNGSDDNTFTDNDILSNLIGVQIDTYNGGAAPTGTALNFNNIVGNTNYGIDNRTTSSLDATKNWWGDTSGPTHSSNLDGTGDAVSDKVDYTPWYTDAAMTTLSNEAEIASYKFEAANNDVLSSDDVEGNIYSSAHTVALTVPYGTAVTNLIATFTLSATGATAEIGTTPQTSGETANNFTSPVIYTITSQDGTITQDWIVIVTLTPPNTDATLSALSLSAGTLSPTFASGTTSYTAQVANSIGSITVTPTATDSNATIKVNNATVTSGLASDPINLEVGDNTITTVVTAQDGTTTNTYTVTVTRAASNVATLSDLTIDGTTISGFSPSSLIYNKVLPYGTTEVPTVAATTTDSNASKVISQATNLTGTEAQRTATVVVTAEDGTTQLTYKVIFGSVYVTITKTGPTKAYQGNNIIYTITYKNVGTFNATNIVVTETYPSEVEFVSSTPAPDEGTNNQWTIGTLAPEQEGTITITVHIK